jgi:hypothetical protein
VVVCDRRKSALLKVGNKSDRIDARKLGDLLRTGLLSALYHGEKVYLSIWSGALHNDRLVHAHVRC